MEDSQRKNKAYIKSKKTYILLWCILAVAVVIIIFNKVTSKSGAFVEVSVDGQTTTVLPLNINTDYLIDGIEGSNHLIIEDGVCFVEEADCPDKLCVKQGKIDKIGQSIICLPHRVVVTIKGDASKEIDSIAK